MRLILIIAFALLSSCINSPAQCNFKTTIKPDGDVIKYFNPKPVIRKSDYEVGIAIYKNITTNEVMLNVSVLFKSMKPQKLNDDVILQTANVKGIRLSPLVSDRVTMNGREVAIGLYKIKKSDYEELKKYNVKSIFFYLEENLIGSTVTENSSILKSELNCFQTKEENLLLQGILFRNNTSVYDSLINDPLLSDIANRNALSYDVQFSLYELAKSPSGIHYKMSRTGTTEVGRNTVFGDSMFDTAFFPNYALNWGDEGGTLNELIAENRAQNQPWIAKVLTIVVVLVLIVVGVVIVLRHKSKTKNICD